jgi:hypothetical protein
VKREEPITNLRAKVWAEAKIATFVGMGQPVVKAALDRTKPKPRGVNMKLETSDGCGQKFPA